MLTKVSEHWWMLRFETPEEGRYVWFGYTEGEVKQKFASWMSRNSMSRLIRRSPMTGALSETDYRSRA